MDIAILMQHLKSFEHTFSHMFDFLPGESLLRRRPCQVVIQVLQDNRWWLDWVYDLVEKEAQRLFLGLKVLKNIALVVETPVPFDALNHNTIPLLVAIGCYSTWMHMKGPSQAHTLRNR